MGRREIWGVGSVVVGGVVARVEGVGVGVEVGMGVVV